MSWKNILWLSFTMLVFSISESFISSMVNASYEQRIHGLVMFILVIYYYKSFIEDKN